MTDPRQSRTQVAGESRHSFLAVWEGWCALALCKDPDPANISLWSPTKPTSCIEQSRDWKACSNKVSRYHLTLRVTQYGSFWGYNVWFSERIRTYPTDQEAQGLGTVTIEYSSFMILILTRDQQRLRPSEQEEICMLYLLARLFTIDCCWFQSAVLAID